MITYFKNQRDLAQELIRIIDDYWDRGLSENDLKSFINQIIQNNREKVYKGNNFTCIIQQRLGKKRLGLLTKIISSEGCNYDNNENN